MRSPSDKFEKPFIDLLERNANLNINLRHIVFFIKKDADNTYIFPDSFLYVIKAFFYATQKLPLFIKEAVRADMIIIHGLYHIYILFFISCLRMVRKSSWVIWGGELYNWFLPGKKHFVLYLIEPLKKIIIKKLNAIISLVPDDYYFARQAYNSSAQYHQAFYPNPVKFVFIDKAQSEKNYYNKKTILLGNSASSTNEHFEVIDFLSSLGIDIPFRVLCPLSYGDKHYASQVADYGHKKLGDLFEPMYNFLDPDEYAKILVSVDVAIMNHRRQQAVGTILALLYAGKKVYIRKNVSTFSWFSLLGIKIFDTEELLTHSNKNLFDVSNDWRKHNKETIHSYFSEENCIRLWKNVFKS